MFSIKFVDKKHKTETCGEVDAVITIGDSKERIRINTGYWSETDYMEQWSAAVEAFLTTDRSSCSLPTEVHPFPLEESDVIELWVLFKAEDSRYVLVRNHLIIGSSGYANLNEALWREEEYERSVGSEDISEWKCDIQDIAGWNNELKLQLST